MFLGSQMVSTAHSMIWPSWLNLQGAGWTFLNSHRIEIMKDHFLKWRGSIQNPKMWDIYIYICIHIQMWDIDGYGESPMRQHSFPTGRHHWWIWEPLRWDLRLELGHVYEFQVRIGDRCRIGNWHLGHIWHHLTLFEPSIWTKQCHMFHIWHHFLSPVTTDFAEFNGNDGNWRTGLVKNLLKIPQSIGHEPVEVRHQPLHQVTWGIQLKLNHPFFQLVFVNYMIPSGKLT